MSFNYESKKEELRRKLFSIKPPSYNFDQDYNRRLLKAGGDVHKTEMPLWTEYWTSDINNKIYTHGPISIGESSTQKKSDVCPQPKEPRMRKDAKTTPAKPPAYESDSSLSPLGVSPSPPAEEPTISDPILISSSPSVPEESSEEDEVENEMVGGGYISDDRPIPPPPPTDSDDDNYELKGWSKRKAALRAGRKSNSTDLGESESDEGPAMKKIGKYTAKVTRKNYIKGHRKRKPASRS